MWAVFLPHCWQLFISEADPNPHCWVFWFRLLTCWFLGSFTPLGEHVLRAFFLPCSHTSACRVQLLRCWKCLLPPSFPRLLLSTPFPLPHKLPKPNNYDADKSEYMWVQNQPHYVMADSCDTPCRSGGRCSHSLICVLLTSLVFPKLTSRWG